MSHKKSKVPAYDEQADYNFDVLPNGAKNIKRFMGFDRPPSSDNDPFWFMSIFDFPVKLETDQNPKTLN